MVSAAGCFTRVFFVSLRPEADREAVLPDDLVFREDVLPAEALAPVLRLFADTDWISLFSCAAFFFEVKHIPPVTILRNIILLFFWKRINYFCLFSRDLFLH